MAEEIATRLAKVQVDTLSPLHPVNTLMEEHRFILRSLERLKALLARLQDSTSLGQMGPDREALKGIAHHLVDAENHHQREEDSLFPRLARHGQGQMTEELRADHHRFREKKRRLYQLAYGPTDAPFDAFRAAVLSAGEYIVRELVPHITREDEVVYQAALEVLTAEEWDEVKRECDAIGYCCFKPADQRSVEEAAPGPRVVDLDLRQVSMLRRLDVILRTWKGIEPGAAIRLVNDREPLPLKLMFRARESGKHEWTYEKEGPTEWVAMIRRKG